LRVHRVTVALLGAGTSDDPYHPGLPTYRLVAVDEAARVALVEVPDDDTPPGDTHAAVLTAPRFERAAIPADLHADALAAWHAHLDNRYAEHAGRFRPQLA
jgi:hypothetical protein